MSKFLNSNQSMGSALSSADIARILAEGKRPRGMPKAEYASLRGAGPRRAGGKAKAGGKRFLDFQLQTTQVNSGVQQYGVGQKLQRSVGSQLLPGATGVDAVSNDSRTSIPSSGVVTETLGERTLDSPYQAERVPLNPGLLTTRLKNISRSFQRYRIATFRIVWTPEVSAFADEGSAGRVCLGHRQDPSDPAPTTMTQSLNSADKVYGLPCERLILDISKDVGKEWHLVRSGRNPGNTSISDYDDGYFFLSSEGVNLGLSPIPSGTLDISYRIEFKDLIDEDVSVFPSSTRCCAGVWNSSAAITSGVPNASWTGLTFDINTEDFARSVTGTIHGLGLSLPPGQYRVRLFGYVGFAGLPTGPKIAILANNVNGTEGAATFPSPANGIMSTNHSSYDAASGYGSTVLNFSTSFIHQVDSETDKTQWMLPVIAVTYASVAKVGSHSVAFMIDTCE